VDRAMTSVSGKVGIASARLLATVAPAKGGASTTS
jgi:hypothetical protein